MGLSETRKTQEIQAAKNENRKFVVSSKQRNKGITVCEIQHLLCRELLCVENLS